MAAWCSGPFLLRLFFCQAFSQIWLLGRIDGDVFRSHFKGKGKLTSRLSSPALEFLTHEGYFVPDEGGRPAGSAMGRGDVARFMLSLLNSNAWVKKGVAVVTK